MRDCIVLSLGTVPYTTAWLWQKMLLAWKVQDRSRPDLLMLLEHPPVYTLGQGADPRYVLFTQGEAELHRIERGGEVTYHAPGQLIGYPILDLTFHGKDLHQYLRQLEEVQLRVLEQLELPGERIPGLTGVWCQGRKVCALGIKVSRWISMHGFALNVCPDLKGFERIVPCGLTGWEVGSLQQWIPDVTVEQIQPLVIQSFAQVFHLELRDAQGSDCVPLLPKT
jgi:lipoyl(octanoyl) transferase